MARYELNDKVISNIFDIMKRAPLHGSEIPVFLEIEGALNNPIKEEVPAPEKKEGKENGG